jgi:hypothetical protein
MSDSRAAWTQALAGATKAQEPRSRGGRSKYHAVRTTAYGRSWASKAELRRYEQLLLLGSAGQIRNLELQPRFDLVVHGVNTGRYTPDFRYEELKFPWEGYSVHHWLDVVEEIKGYMVRDYRLRRELFKALHPHITFREVR